MHSRLTSAQRLHQLAEVMDQSGKQGRFDELSPEEQHTVQTYIDELSRRDTLVDQMSAAPEDGEFRDSQIYAIPSADSDRRGALAVLANCS